LIKFNREERERFLNKNLKAALATLDKNGFPLIMALFLKSS
jgi:hypothetical protein